MSSLTYVTNDIVFPDGGNETTVGLAQRVGEDAAVLSCCLPRGRSPATPFAARRFAQHAVCATHANARSRCGELRIPDATLTWRILCRLDPDAVVIVDVFDKKTPATPATILATGRERLRRYDQVTQSEG